MKILGTNCNHNLQTLILKVTLTLELFIFFKTDSRFHSPNFNLFIEDSDFYQEHGRLSLYIYKVFYWVHCFL